MKNRIKGFLVLVIMAGFISSLFAYQEEGRMPSPELKNEMVKLNYIQANKAYRLLLAYKSRYGAITYDNDLNILTLSDTPEIVEKMLEVIKELDTPPVDLIFTVDILMGSRKEMPDKVDKDLMSDPLVKELKKLLNYTSFKRIDTSFIRVQDGHHAEQRVGGHNLDLQLYMRPRYIKDSRNETIQVELAMRQIQMRGVEPKNINLLETSLTLKSGDRTVVGVSKLNGGDNALILILHGKVDK
ncbi:MAG: hypothetical protein GQ544_09270 [Candidatus Aminicenantes bacterium]|nr:hypothetical protein [Candidatus Aminicenantes bacterium]